MRTAEALRAPSQTVGALRLAELCHGLIEAAREGDTGFAHEKLPLLRETCRLTKTAMAGARTVGNT